MLKNQAYTRLPNLLFPFKMPICEPNDVFLANPSPKLTKLLKNKRAAIGSTSDARRQPGASDAVHRSLRGGRGASGRAGGCLSRLPHILLLTTMASDDEHKHHKHKHRPVYKSDFRRPRHRRDAVFVTVPAR